MKNHLKLIPLFLITLLLFPATTQAHSVGGNGMVSGLAHPIFGLDHLLAMVAVGIIATQFNGKAMWQVPASFLAFMLLGGILAISGVQLPMVETAIGLSVLLLGVGIALSKKFSINGMMACVGFFALFHGQAHGAEMPLVAHPAFYALGFVASTAVLHFAGILIGKYAKKTQFTFGMLRYAGVSMAMIGISFF